MKRVDLHDFVRDPEEVIRRSTHDEVAVVDDGIVVAVFGASFTERFQAQLPRIDWSEVEEGDFSAFRSMRWFE